MTYKEYFDGVCKLINLHLDKKISEKEVIERRNLLELEYAKNNGNKVNRLWGLPNEPA